MENEVTFLYDFHKNVERETGTKVRDCKLDSLIIPKFKLFYTFSYPEHF